MIRKRERYHASDTSWRWLHWPSASLSFHDCAADVKNSLFKAELVTFRRPSMQAWGKKAQCYDYHQRGRHRCFSTSTHTSCIWCTVNHVKSGFTRCCTDVVAEGLTEIFLYYLYVDASFITWNCNIMLTPPPPFHAGLKRQRPRHP